MAYSEELADRIRDVISDRSGVSERKMFGGIAFMVNGNMAVGVIREDMMVRLDKEDHEAALAEPHVRPMDFTGKRMTGFVYVDPLGIAEPEELSRWVDTGADFAASLPPK